MKKLILLVIAVLILGLDAFAEDKKPERKTQRVDFEEETIDGQARKPDGSYLVEKRAVDFVPLYRVREHFDENIKSSVEYLK